MTAFAQFKFLCFQIFRTSATDFPHVTGISLKKAPLFFGRFGAASRRRLA
jgi:hypothetical protein